MVRAPWVITKISLSVHLGSLRIRIITDTGWAPELAFTHGPIHAFPRIATRRGWRYQCGNTYKAQNVYDRNPEPALPPWTAQYTIYPEYYYVPLWGWWVHQIAVNGHPYTSPIIDLIRGTPMPPIYLPLH